MAPAVLSSRRAEAPIRVVVADDSAAIRTLARHALSTQRGFSVAEAADGFEALAALDTFRPDCVVLDIQMPRMGGFQALAEFQERAPGLPVILLSGQSDGAVADEAMRCGAVSYVDKSHSLTDLADAVRRVTTTGQDPAPEPSEPTVAAAVPLTSAATDQRISIPAAEPLAATVPLATADDAEKELRRLEYVVSHDLGEPLRIMTGFAGLLDSRYKDSLDATGQTFLGHIVDAAGRLQSMLDDLLAYSRAGREDPRPTCVDLTATAGRAVQSLRDEILTRGAEVTIAPLPPALGDEAMLLTVLGHVIRNGIVFNQSPQPTVHLAGRLDGTTARVTVTDNGIGVDPKDRDRIFDLFVRLNAREAYPGTGTGLTLSRRLVTRQGGTISVDGADKEGTTVTIALPAATD